jgi:hypothetical protein
MTGERARRGRDKSDPVGATLAVALGQGLALPLQLNSLLFILTKIGTACGGSGSPPARG